MKMDTPMTIGKVAAVLGIPPSTARGYVKDFGDTAVFSESATPAPGQTRLFVEDDIRVMWTIKYLRAQRKQTDEIIDALIAGERFYPESDQSTQDAPGQAETADHGQPIEETQINALVKFQDTVNDLTAQLIESERGRVAAETELRIVKQMLDKDDKRRWWRFWD